MSDFDGDLQNKTNDTNNISINFSKHLKNGRHRAKYNFVHDPTDIIDSNIQKYNGIDYIKLLHGFIEEMKLANVEFSVFQCRSNSKIPAFYANIKHGNSSLASSFPEKYSLPEVAQQVAARNALTILKKNNFPNNIPVTQDMAVVAERLETELKKNYAGLFCDKVEDIYKQVYNESLPSDWLARLSRYTINILIEDLPNQNKSILYYASLADKKKQEQLIDISMTETCENLPLMKFIDKTERSVNVVSIDSNRTFWILFVHDSINDEYDTLFKLMNMPDESVHFIKMFDIEVLDIYAVRIDLEWYRFQVTKIEDDTTNGVLIDLGMEWCVAKNDVKFLPPKFLKVPSQAIKCALSSLFFAPYFQIACNLFQKMLIGKEFTVVPDNIDKDIQLVTLYDGKCNMNNRLMEMIIEQTSFNQIDGTCEKVHLSFIGDGYIYLHPPKETLIILESILDSISSSQPLHKLYSKKNISPHKIYLVKCPELDMWSRAIINDFTFDDEKFKVYFIDYGNYGFIDRDKFIDLLSIDLLLAKIGPQALKVSFHLFPPEKLIGSLSRALYETINEKALDVEVVSTNVDGMQVVEIFDAGDEIGNKISYNTQLYQSI